jgi:putative DeoR family transcriptional regulator (stage III sporulation protein D)
MIVIKGDTRERCVILAEYMINNKATVRKTAYRFGISKSTVHKDVAEKLQKINPALYSDVKTILDTNKAERHIRGGEATKEKYKKTRREIKKD